MKFLLEHWVRSIYHETVHARLMLGIEKGFFQIFPSGEKTFASEVVAFGKMLEGNHNLPPLRDKEIKFYSQNGLNYYNSLITKYWKDYLKGFETYFNNKLKKSK